MSAHIEGKGKVRKTKSSLISFLFTYIERKGKVSVKTSEEHKEGSDEIVNGRLQIILINLIIVKKDQYGQVRYGDLADTLF